MLGRKKPQIRYWSNGSPARMKAMASRPNEFQAKRTSEKVGKQLLLTLVHSLPTHATESARSPSSCAPTIRRRVRADSISLKVPEKVTHTQPPNRLQTGMSVRQVSAGERTTSRAAEPVRPSVSFSVEAFLRRRKASAKAKAKAREEQLEKLSRVKGGDDPSPKRSREASNQSIQDTGHSQKNSKNSSGKSSNRGSEKSSLRSSQKNSSEKINQDSPTSSLKSMAPKDSDQDISQRTSQTGISPKSSQDIAQGDGVETQPGEIKQESEEDSKEPTDAIAPKSCQEQPVQTKSRIYPCFRGEYPSRNCPGSYVWFKAAVPDCGNVVAIRDGDPQVMRQAEYVTSCEVTEEHYLTIDEDNADDLPVDTPCKTCRQAMYTQKPQQQQQQPQQQDVNWFGSSHMQQQVPRRQQQVPRRQQQVPYRQQQLACMQYSPSRTNRQTSQMQQQRPFMQQQRSNCRQNAAQKLCSKCQDQQKMALQVQNQEMQPSQIQDNNYCLTKMLAEELKKQMEIAQAQIAQVQLQLQFMNTMATERVVDEDITENADENLEEDTLPLDQLQAQPMQVVSQPSQRISQASGQRGPYPVPLPMPNRSPGYQEQDIPFPSQKSPSGLQQVPTRQQAYPSKQPFPPFQQEGPPCQRDRPPCQQQLPPCQEQLPPCQQEQHYMPPCQQQQPSYPCQQNLNTNQTPSPSPPNKCPYAPNYCPSCCCQRYAQMRFMMPRCWPR